MAKANASNEMKALKDEMTVQTKNEQKSNNDGAVAEEKAKNASQEVKDVAVRERELKNSKKNCKGKGIKKVMKNVSAAIDDERSNANPGTSSQPQAEDPAKNEKNKKGKTPKYGKYPKKEKNKNSTSSVVEEDKPNPKQEVRAQKKEGKEGVSKKPSLNNDIKIVMEDAITSIITEITVDFKDFNFPVKNLHILYDRMRHEIYSRLKAFGWTKLGKMNNKAMVAAYKTYHNKVEDIQFLVKTYHEIEFEFGDDDSVPTITDAELDVINANVVAQPTYNRQPSDFGGPSCSGVVKIWKGKGDD